MLFSLGDLQWSLLIVKIKYFSLKCWPTHGITMEDPFPQSASLPVRNECHVPSLMLSDNIPSCWISSPSPPLLGNFPPCRQWWVVLVAAPDTHIVSLNPLQLLHGLQRCHREMLWEQKCYCPMLAAGENYSWVSGFFKAGSSISLPRVI